MELVTFIYIVETLLTIEPPSFINHIILTLIIIFAASLFNEHKDFYSTAAKVIEFAKKPVILYFSALLVVNVLWAFIPSKDTAYKMLAAYGVNEVYLATKESEEVKEIAKKSLMVIEASLDKYTKEIEASDNPDLEANQ